MSETGALESKMDALHRQIKRLESEVEELREEKAELEQELSRARQRITDLEGRTDLLDRVERASALGAEEKAIVLIQTLRAEAGSNGTAAMDATQAVKALGGEIDRTSMYGETGVFQRAEDLVDNTSVVWYERESRASSKNSRLVLDRSAGELPKTVKGHNLREEAARAG